MSRRGESIYKRKDGRWEARYIHHYENGKAKYRYLYGKTYTEAKAKRAEELMRPQNVSVSSVKSIAKFEELSRLWLSDTKPNVKESTYARYYRIVNKYLCPSLSDKMLAKIDRKYIKNFSEYLLSNGGKNGDPLSPKTVYDMISVLKSIFRYGTDHDYPCRDIQNLKMPILPKQKVRIVNASYRTKIEQMILDSQPNDNKFRVKLGILFTLYTGVRIGELCGLKNSDIDLTNNVVSINRTVERIADLDHNSDTKTKVIVNEPKTQTSIRMIPLPSFLADYLRPFISSGDQYLLTGTDKYTEPHQFYMRYKTFMKSLGLGEYSFHSLRHTFATRCIDNGFDPKSLSEILGHANVSTTLALYVHPTIEHKRKQMERLKPDSRL